MFFITFLRLLFEILTWLILARIILSWIDQRQSWSITHLIQGVTEPILAPIRRILPSTGMLDLSPMILLLLLYVLKSVV